MIIAHALLLLIFILSKQASDEKQRGEKEGFVPLVLCKGITHLE